MAEYKKVDGSDHRSRAEYGTAEPDGPPLPLNSLTGNGVYDLPTLRTTPTGNSINYRDINSGTAEPDGPPLPNDTEQKGQLNKAVIKTKVKIKNKITYRNSVNKRLNKANNNIYKSVSVKSETVRKRKENHGSQRPQQPGRIVAFKYIKTRCRGMRTTGSKYLYKITCMLTSRK